MHFPQPLLDDIASGKCLPFIGAGFSLNANLPDGASMPSWPELTESLANTVDISPEIGGPGVASAFESKYGRVQLIETIRKELHTDSAQPGLAHKAFIPLPFDTVYTTNFDLLLENTCILEQKPFRSLVGERQIPFHGGPHNYNIIKMHGDLRHEEHMIITKEDYDEFIDKYPVLATHLSALLITKTAFFIGYSLSDPDFQNILKVVQSRLGKFMRMAYIIQFNKSTGDFDRKLKDNLHIININADSDGSKDSQLAKLFIDIQKYLDISEGEKLRGSRPEVFENIVKETFESTSNSDDASFLLTSSSNLCFIMLPPQPEFDKIFNLIIRPATEKFGLEVTRQDAFHFQGSIAEKIRVAIQQSRLCIADISTLNPNILYEVRMAHSLNKPIILLSNRDTDIPNDLRSIRCIFYHPDNIEGTRNSLEKSIQQVLGKDLFNEILNLIETGMYRAAVAMLGVLLEHSFRALIYGHDSGQYKGYSLRKGLSKLIELKIIDSEEESILKECIMLRNRAVHELEEPTGEDAQFMLNIVQKFVEKYDLNFLVESEDSSMNIARR